MMARLQSEGHTPKKEAEKHQTQKDSEGKPSKFRV